MLYKKKGIDIEQQKIMRKMKDDIERN